MTDSWECPVCGGPMEVAGTNDAEYPEPLIETRSCENCGYSRKEVLTA
jgi:C4-type Zn-finger protein